jgi:hypothetical protein
MGGERFLFFCDVKKRVGLVPGNREVSSPPVHGLPVTLLAAGKILLKVLAAGILV